MYALEHDHALASLQALNESAAGWEASYSEVHAVGPTGACYVTVCRVVELPGAGHNYPCSRILDPSDPQQTFTDARTLYYCNSPGGC